MPMLRPRVVTASDVRRTAPRPDAHTPTTAPEQEDNFLLKLTKYIPAEIVAVYQVTAGTIATWTSPWSRWVSLGWIAFLAVFTAVWIPYATSDENHEAHKYQACSAVIAFLVWAFALGGSWVVLLPSGLADARPVLGGLAVAAATLLIPLLEQFFSPSVPDVPEGDAAA